MTTLRRKRALLPHGIPKYIRCYDSGGTGDRYTVVFTGVRSEGLYLGMNAAPFHPQGIGQHGYAASKHQRIDRPTSSHLGKRITFKALPTDCKRLVLRDYMEIWGLK